MAAKTEDQDEGQDRSVDKPASRAADTVDDDETEDDAEEEDEEDEEDDEPKLKYARLTGHLAPVYRNGDATSAFLVAGDKMVCLQSARRQRRLLMLYSSLAHTTVT
jgi:vacuolar protein sorting-associated protein 41